MLIEDYLDQKINLHILLNSDNCPDDIDEQFKKLHSDVKIKEQTNLIFDKNGKYYSTHDGVIQKINFIKKGNLILDFKVRGFVYENGSELGYQDINMLIQLSKGCKLKAHKKDIVFECVFDGHQMGLITLNRKHEHSIDIVDYTSLSFSLGKFYPYNKNKK